MAFNTFFMDIETEMNGTCCFDFSIYKQTKVGVASSETILQCSVLQCPLLLNKNGRKRERKHKRDAADLSNTG